jgi:hypothetical protein
MRHVTLLCSASAFALLALISCGPPKNNVPLEDIPKIAKLKDLMDAQATFADPQFKKIGKAPYADADFAAFADTGKKIDATSTKLKDFTMGGTFDEFAARLNEKAKALEAAGEAKDAAAAEKALVEMKATCKECHATWR